MSDYITKYEGWVIIEGNKNSKTKFSFEIDNNYKDPTEEGNRAESAIMEIIDYDFGVVEIIDNRKYKGIYGGEYKTKDEAFDAEIKILLEKKLPEVSELCDFYDKYRVLWRSSKHFEDFKLNKKY